MNESDFVTAAMLSSVGTAITLGVAKADYPTTLTLAETEEWDELAAEIVEMLTDGITPEFPDDWLDDLPMSNLVPRPQSGLPLSAL